MYTSQEAFDKVVRHLVAQGRPALDLLNKNCAYLSEDGLKCAAGCLIPDDSISLNLNFYGNWPTLRAAYPHLKLELIADYTLVSIMQLAHDYNSLTPAWRKSWVQEMLKCARDYAIDPAVLNELATQEWQDVSL